MHWYIYIYIYDHVIPSELWVSIRPSVIRLSVSASFPCSNFSTFWLIFFKLCIDIGIGEEWYGIASGLISFWNNRVMALDVCQKCFVLRFRALTLVRFYQFCICINIYIWSTSIQLHFAFSLFFNWVMALDLCTKCVSPKCLPNKWLHFEKILLVLSKFKMHNKCAVVGYLGS